MYNNYKIYAPNDRSNMRSKTVKTKVQNRQLYNNSWRLQYLSLSNRTTRQRISKEIKHLNNTINQPSVQPVITEHPTQQQQTHSFQVHMRYFPG